MTPAQDELAPFPPPWGDAIITGGDDAPTFEQFSQWAYELEALNTDTQEKDDMRDYTSDNEKTTEEETLLETVTRRHEEGHGWSYYDERGRFREYDQTADGWRAYINGGKILEGRESLEDAIWASLSY